MLEQNLIGHTSELNPKKVRGSQVAVIRTLIQRGFNIKQIYKETGYLMRHIQRTHKNFPIWRVKEDAKLKVRRLTRLLRGEEVNLRGVIVKFLEQSRTHVYFINTNGKIENIKKEDFIGEILL